MPARRAQQVAERVLFATDESLSLRDRAYAYRDRLLESSFFQRFSSSFLLTRPIARAQARALFDICAGFVYSQILAACVQLDLFRILKAGPRSTAELSRELSIPADAMERLLLAAVSLRLLARRGKNRFGLGMLGAALNGNPGISAMIEHHAMLYRDLEDPIALLRGEKSKTNLARYWPYAGDAQPEFLDTGKVRPYGALMAASQSFIAQDVLDAYPFERHRCLLDVGGGEGAFIAAAAERFSKLRFMLFDLPAVVACACERFSAAGIGSRVNASGGSFLSDALPRGADLVSLVRVVHDHDDGEVMTLLKSVHAALPPGGTILIAEPMSEVPGAEPVGDAYFGMYLLAMGRGRPRSAARLSQMLREAGFADVTQCNTRRPMLVSVVTAVRHKGV